MKEIKRLILIGMIGVYFCRFLDASNADDLFSLVQKRGQTRAYLFTLDELFKYSDLVVFGEVKEIKIKYKYIVDGKILDADELPYEECKRLNSKQEVKNRLYTRISLTPIRFFKTIEKDYKSLKEIIIQRGEGTYVHPSLEFSITDRALLIIRLEEVEVGDKIICFLNDLKKFEEKRNKIKEKKGEKEVWCLEKPFSFTIWPGAWGVFNLIDDTFYLHDLYLQAKWDKSERLKKEIPLEKPKEKPIPKSCPLWEDRYHPQTKLTKQDIEDFIKKSGYHPAQYSHLKFKTYPKSGMKISYSKEELFKILEDLAKSREDK